MAFPSLRHSHKPMSGNAIGYLLNRIGYHGRHVPHGWRAAFSTLMNEWAKTSGRADEREVIDLMLAHTQGNKVESAYNRSAYMPRRTELSQIWGDRIRLDADLPAVRRRLQRDDADGRLPVFLRLPSLRAVLRPLKGDCCVFCSYGDVPCPPIQEGRETGSGGLLLPLRGERESKPSVVLRHTVRGKNDDACAC